jgi:hypothetical protein
MRASRPLRRDPFSAAMADSTSSRSQRSSPRTTSASSLKREQLQEEDDQPATKRPKLHPDKRKELEEWFEIQLDKYVQTMALHGEDPFEVFTRYLAGHLQEGTKADTMVKKMSMQEGYKNREDNMNFIHLLTDIYDKMVTTKYEPLLPRGTLPRTPQWDGVMSSLDKHLEEYKTHVQLVQDMMKRQ